VEIPEFWKWKEEKYVPFVRRTGAKLIGVWITVVGQVGTFQEIWAFENYAAMDESTKHFISPSSEADKQTLKEISKYHKETYSDILRGIPSLAPTKDLLE
jgi:hypothetical protein